MADCPECEYCCVLGICCPPAEQHTALVDLFVKAGAGNEVEAAKYADAIISARAKALAKHGKA